MTFEVQISNHKRVRDIVVVPIWFLTSERQSL
jgi:hypothetical protein